MPLTRRSTTDPASVGIAYRAAICARPDDDRPGPDFGPGAPLRNRYPELWRREGRSCQVFDAVYVHIKVLASNATFVIVTQDV